MTTPLYGIYGLAHFYRGQPVLEIERLEILQGTIVGIIGPNGSGKSTFLRLAGFVEKPSAGEIRFRGRPAEPFAPEVRQRVTLMPQEPFLMKRTVFNNVAFGLRLRKDLVRLEQRVQEALSWVGLNERVFGSRPWYALSGGEAQRVALAARLILKPDVLLLDEPTANVDALSAQLIQEAALKARRDWGTTLIMASHDRQWLHEVADSILHLFKGRMAGNGRENILFGPWEPMGDQRWCKQLPDGQRLQVPPPPGDASAVLISKTVLLTPAEATPAAGRVVVSGMVTRLTLESASGDLLVSVLAGGLPLTVVMHPEQASRSRIYPGRAVAVGYHLADVVWLKA